MGGDILLKGFLFLDIDADFVRWRHSKDGQVRTVAEIEMQTTGRRGQYRTAIGVGIDAKGGRVGGEIAGEQQAQGRVAADMEFPMTIEMESLRTFALECPASRTFVEVCTAEVTVVAQPATLPSCENRSLAARP